MITSKTTTLLVGSLLLAFACNAFEGTHGTAADIRGKVTSIRRADAQNRERGILGSVLVEGALEDDTSFDKASVTVTDKTRIFEQKGKNRRPATFKSLKKGQGVQVRFIGPVMQSYPVQATASEIVIFK